MFKMWLYHENTHSKGYHLNGDSKRLFCYIFYQIKPWLLAGARTSETATWRFNIDLSLNGSCADKLFISFSFFIWMKLLLSKTSKTKYDVFYGSWCLTVLADWPLFTVLVLRIKNGLYFVCWVKTCLQQSSATDLNSIIFQLISAYNFLVQWFVARDKNKINNTYPCMKP